MQNQQIPVPDKWTILSLLRWSAAYFDSHRIDSPRATAEILLAHVLQVQRIDLYLRYDQPLSGDELHRFKKLVRRRIAREPVAYITGSREFWSLDLHVGPDVLIPRPETECLVEAVLKILSAPDGERQLRVLDLGAGSGAISIALARQARRHSYIAVDSSPQAVATARENAVRHGHEGHIAFVAADWLSAFSKQVRFDIVVSNPPYIRSADIGGLQPEIRNYEPRVALDGGSDGLTCIRYLIQHSGDFLVPGGFLLLEIGYDQQNAVADIVRRNGWCAQVDFSQDYSGIDRIAIIGKKI